MKLPNAKVVAFKYEQTILYRAVVSGGAGGALAPPEFGSSVNPIPTREAHYAHPITASTPRFQNLSTALRLRSSGKFLIRMKHMGQTYYIVSFGEHHTYNLSYGPCSVNNETWHNFLEPYYGGEQRAGVGLRAVSWGKGSFKNYVDKMRGVVGQKMPNIVQIQGEKNPGGGKYSSVPIDV